MGMNTFDRLVLSYLSSRSGELVRFSDLVEKFGDREKVEKSINRLWKAWLVEIIEVGDSYGSILYVRFPASLIL